VGQQFVVHPEARHQSASVWKAGAQAAHGEPRQSGTPTSVTPVDVVGSGPAPHSWLSAPLHRKFEERVIRALATPRKVAKYERDRHAFFSDSRNPVLKAWFRWQP
jgi:hypothetical protein